MKIFKAMLLGLVALLAFTGCEKFTCNDSHKVSELAGTWTCFQENFAEALVIKANGSVVSTGVENGEYWENVKGNIAIQDGKISMIFEDDDNTEGHFDFIPEMAFSVCTDKGERYTYNYCKEDLSDEIVGMWVCNDGLPEVEKDMAITTYSEDGKMIMTTQFSAFIPADLVNAKSDYKVVGDLKFHIVPNANLASRVIYTPKRTSLGDIFTQTLYSPSVNGLVKITSSFLRIKQTLDLAGKEYDYIKAFVTNAKGIDKDVDIMGSKFNFAKMDGVKLNKMLKTLLFAVEFPNANTIRYNYFYNGKNNSLEAPIVVDGNKMTVKMSQKNPLFKDIDLYTFQDADATQMHMYMPTYAFINFFGNMQATIMAQNGLLDLTDATAVNAVYDSIKNALETINVSLVMEKAK
jgi:roadblock/LC7 domain-containing protein